ncbi:hypothetical protein C8Q79DRAFT_179057 [Trametes meyenii]|nr:hypothetical protein C8Q79DRAFT_179057 [Trametes meyenii]
MDLYGRSPINRLPVETLVHIFHEVQAAARSDSDVFPICKQMVPEKQAAAWLPVSSVCRSWRTAACAAPLLWRDIDIGKDTALQLVRLFLERSGKVSLNVRISGASDIGPHLDLLKAHAARIREISFSMVRVDQESAVLSFLQHDMLLLERLRVDLGSDSWHVAHCQCYMAPDKKGLKELSQYTDREMNEHYDELHPWIPEPMPHTISFRDGQFPALRDLALLHATPATLASLNAAQLTHLDLGKVDHPPVSFADFLSFLRQCKELKNLRLDCYHFSNLALPMSKADQEGGARIAFGPELQELVLRGPPAYTSTLLRAISIPATANISITRLACCSSTSGSDYEADGPEVSYATVHDCLPGDRSGLPLLDTIDRVDVAMLASIKRACDWNITGYAGKTSFSIVFEAHTDFRDLPGELEAIFGRSPVVELRILGAFRNRNMHTVAEWERVLRLFPLLERIEFANAAPWKKSLHGATGPFLQALALPADGNSLICPNLKELAFATGKDDKRELVLEALTLTLRTRAGPGPRPGRECHKLAKLRIGVLSGVEPPPLKDPVPRHFPEKEDWYVQQVRASAGDAVETVVCSNGCNWLNQKPSEYRPRGQTVPKFDIFEDRSED